jgi:hypothetical protein
MATSATHRDRPQRYTARLEVYLDPATQTKITRFVTAIHRRRSAVLRHVLEWSLSHGQGWKIDRSRPLGRAQRVFLRLEPERRERVEDAATAAGGDISAWLRYAVQQVNVADFPEAKASPVVRPNATPGGSVGLRCRFQPRGMAHLLSVQGARQDQ